MTSASASINSLMESFARPDITTTISKAIIDRHHISAPANGYKRKEYSHDYDGHYHSHGYGHRGKKRSIALSALTLLSFLFFLHILQNCLQEHMDSMNNTIPTQIIIMQARIQAARRREAQKRKADDQPINITPFYDNGTSILAKESRSKINPTKKFDKYNTVSQIPIKLKIAERHHRP